MAGRQWFEQTQLFLKLPLDVPPRLKSADAAQDVQDESNEAEGSAAKEEISVTHLAEVFESVQTAKRTLRELRLLRLCKHANVVGINSIFFSDNSAVVDVCVVRDIMDCNLSQLISCSQPITTEYASFFLNQILRGMKFVHSAQVIHGDLQPDNIYLRENGELKIGGFGLNSFQSSGRWCCSGTGCWYCAPEVLGGSVRTPALDLWAIACMWTEMHLRRPLFPGRGTLQHLLLVCSLLGTPTEEELAVVGSSLCPASQRRLMMGPGPSAGGGETEGVGLLRNLLPAASADELDLLSQMLRWQPSERVDAGRALEHPLFSCWRDPEDTPTREPLRARDVAFEEATSLVDVHMEFFLEVLNYHPTAKERYETQVADDLVILSSTRKLSSSIRRAVDESGASFKMMETGCAATNAVLRLVQHCI